MVSFALPLFSRQPTLKPNDLIEMSGITEVIRRLEDNLVQSSPILQVSYLSTSQTQNLGFLILGPMLFLPTWPLLIYTNPLGKYLHPR